jgi:fucose 4-O-acetylase-like acetyltransferase
MNSSRDGISGLFAQAFNSPLLEDKRYQWVDYLRGIAIMLIVYRHVLIGIQRGQIEVPEILVNANMIFYSFRMPLFFILSGIFIGRSLSKYPIGDIILKKFQLLFYPYLVWATIQICLQIFFSDVTNSARGLKDFGYIFTQPRELDQFWYLPALFNTSVVYLLLKSKLKLHIALQLLLGVIFYFISSTFDIISMLSDWMAFYIFFAVGDLIASRIFRPSTRKLLTNRWTILTVIPIFIIVQHYYLQHDFGNFALTMRSDALKPSYLDHLTGQAEFLLIALTGCFSMFVLAFKLQDWQAFKFLRIIGFHSLYIYVMHVIITAAIRLTLIIIFGIANPLVLLVTSITFGIVIPILFYNLVVKDGPGWFLFNYRKNNKADSLDASEKSSISSGQRL